ncbi:Hsp20/alpha crystallin family protein [Methanoculleus sp.]|uniref:Hsp20/alpha crystallin family protein n=1 Tax=Methanoculleus sp. TaxID=90427 RepID=UPI002FC64B4B
MAWRGPPRGLRAEFDEMLGEMQKQFSDLMGRISGGSSMGAAGTMLDVREDETEVMVVADLPGVDTEKISVRLLDPRTLRITARREEATETEQAGYFVRERRVGTISRTATLPVDVEGEGARATFKNGVLEVRLKKVAQEIGREIPLHSEEGQSLGEEHREQVEREYREDREKMRPSGYLSSRELEEAAEKITIPETGSAEEQKNAAELREQKKRLYEEGKKKLAG